MLISMPQSRVHWPPSTATQARLVLPPTACSCNRVSTISLRRSSQMPPLRSGSVMACMTAWYWVRSSMRTQCKRSKSTLPMRWKKVHALPPGASAMIWAVVTSSQRCSPMCHVMHSSSTMKPSALSPPSSVSILRTRPLRWPMTHLLAWRLMCTRVTSA
ncbi:hypothetical protein D3C75_976960 [compost metagenome]